MVEKWSWMFHNATMPLMFLCSLWFLLLPSSLYPEHAVHTVLHMCVNTVRNAGTTQAPMSFGFSSTPFLYSIIFLEHVALSCCAVDRFAANYIHSIPQRPPCGACSWGARRQTAMEQPCRAHLLSERKAWCNKRPSHLVQQKSFCTKPDHDQNCKTHWNWYSDCTLYRTRLASSGRAGQQRLPAALQVKISIPAR